MSRGILIQLEVAWLFRHHDNRGVVRCLETHLPAVPPPIPAAHCGPLISRLVIYLYTALLRLLRPDSVCRPALVSWREMGMSLLRF